MTRRGLGGFAELTFAVSFLYSSAMCALSSAPSYTVRNVPGVEPPPGEASADAFPPSFDGPYTWTGKDGALYMYGGEWRRERQRASRGRCRRRLLRAGERVVGVACRALRGRRLRREKSIGLHAARLLI